MYDSKLGESYDESNKSKNMAKRKDQEEGRESLVIMEAFGGGTRLGMLTTTIGRIGNKEDRWREKRGRNTVGLNRNQTPGQDED